MTHTLRNVSRVETGKFTRWRTASERYVPCRRRADRAATFRSIAAPLLHPAPRQVLAWTTHSGRRRPGALKELNRGPRATRKKARERKESDETNRGGAARYIVPAMDGLFARLLEKFCISWPCMSSMLTCRHLPKRHSMHVQPLVFATAELLRIQAPADARPREVRPISKVVTPRSPYVTKCMRNGCGQVAKRTALYTRRATASSWLRHIGKRLLPAPGPCKMQEGGICVHDAFSTHA